MNDPVVLTLGAVADLVLNRPEKHNAMTEEMGTAISLAVERLNAERDVRVVRIRGAGRAFSAGGDFDLLEQNASSAPEDNRRRMEAFYRIFLSVLRLERPSVAVIHGAAVGAGLCLAAACDLRIAASEAKLGANFVRVGLHPGMGCTLLLPQLVGEAKARELLLTGSLIDGNEAARIGLVNRAVPRDQLETAVAEVTEQLASAAPIAVAQTKRTLAAPVLARLEATLARESLSQAVTFATDDLKEAVAAFRQGRAPRFTGS